MSGLTLAALLHASLLTVGVDDYAEAHRATMESGKPMLVMVSAEWCGACQDMERNVLPEVKKHDVFKKVSFAKVNLDSNRELAEQLIGGSGPVPQLVMFRRNGDGWLRKKLVGRQSTEAVEEFIAQGIERDQADKESAPDAKEPSDSSKSTAAIAQKPTTNQVVGR